MYGIRALGVTIRVAGATDLWNNYLQYKATTKEAKSAGRLVPGALLFHIEGGTAEHVGWYTGIKGKEVAHASRGNKKVVLSPISNYYDHVGWPEAVNYSVTEKPATEPDPTPPSAPEPERPIQTEPGPGEAMVVTQESAGVRLRKQPKIADGNVICEVPRGTILPILERSGGWTKVPYTKNGMPHVGWIRDDMLRFGEGDA